MFFLNLGLLDIGQASLGLLQMVIAALGFVGLPRGLLWGAGDIRQRGFFGLF